MITEWSASWSPTCSLTEVVRSPNNRQAPLWLYSEFTYLPTYNVTTLFTLHFSCMRLYAGGPIIIIIIIIIIINHKIGKMPWLIQRCWISSNLCKINWKDEDGRWTWRMREISQGRAPLWASSTILCRVESGRGRPLTKTPPSWLTPLCPSNTRTWQWISATPYRTCRVSSGFVINVNFHYHEMQKNTSHSSTIQLCRS